MGLPSIERKLELKKHVNLIHCSNSFSLVQRKLFNALLFNAYSDLATKNQFSLPSKTLCEMIGYKSNDSKSLKKALLGLLTIVVEWNVIDYNFSKSSDKWVASSALASATIGNGICTYEYSLAIKELFYQPEIYGRINIGLLPKFKSSYGLSLYENCIRYNGISQTQWFTLEVFRKLMGVSDDQYPIFRDFKRRVLDIAVKEVNLHSSTTIFPETKRLSGKVVSIRFKIESKQGIVPAEPANHNIEVSALKNVLQDNFGLSVKNIESILESYELNYIQEKVNLVLNSDSCKLGKIRELPAYLIKALKEDYKSSKPSKAIVSEKRRAKERAESTEKNKIKELKQAYNQYVTATINKHFLNMAEDARQFLVEEFEHTLKQGNNIAYKWYQKSKFEHAAVKSLFNNFVKNNQEAQLKDLLSFEYFNENFCNDVENV